MKKLFTTFLIATAFLFTGVVGDAAQRKTTQLQSQDHLPNYCLLIKDERTPQENCPIGQDPIVRTHHKQRAAQQATLAKQRHQTTVPKVNQTPPANNKQNNRQNKAFKMAQGQSAAKIHKIKTALTQSRWQPQMSQLPNLSQLPQPQTLLIQ